MADKGDRMGRGRELFSGQVRVQPRQSALWANVRSSPLITGTRGIRIPENRPVLPLLEKIIRVRRIWSDGPAMVASESKNTMVVNQIQPTCLQIANLTLRTPSPGLRRASVSSH
jgi:hypothetical protein